MTEPVFFRVNKKAYSRDDGRSTVIVSKTRAKSLFSTVYNE
jgi:hypothetical protein